MGVKMSIACARIKSTVAALGFLAKAATAVATMGEVAKLSTCANLGTVPATCSILVVATDTIQLIVVVLAATEDGKVLGGGSGSGGTTGGTTAEACVMMSIVFSLWAVPAETDFLAPTGALLPAMRLVSLALLKEGELLLVVVEEEVPFFFLGVLLLLLRRGG